MNYSILDLLERYAEVRRKDGYSEDTISRVLTTVGMVAQDLQISRLEELATEAILKWGESRKAGEFGRKPLAPSTLSADYASIRSFALCLEQLEIEHSIDRSVVRSRATYKRRKALRADDIKRILVVVDDKEIAVLTNLLFHTGMRISEAIKLKAEDISWKNEIVVTGKSKYSRVVFLHDRLRWEIKSLHDDHGYYFRDRRRDGGHMTRKVAYYHLTKFYKLAGYEGYSPHSERHGHATELLSRGANLALVSKEIGHVNVQTTHIYTHLVTDDTRRMMEEYMPIIKSF